ncbi:Aldehyde oxidase GLOX1 [Dichanthelium oligosanthes]|uniref:Aldehyde oxidase GLOX1 n=1 Tax=Dichanthelium oligosanthes TaxID=888268 RepID=A0A1E5VAT6_9POAL|nr:Aldehyde oxidase GLOX1 [Dichanthelium oligosanthes]
MGPLLLLRAAVLSAALLALAAVGEAHGPHGGFGDFLNIFRPRNEHDYFHNANQGQEENVRPRASDQPNLAAAPVSRSGLMKVPARSAPTAAAQDTVVLPVDHDAAGGFPGAWSTISENAGVSAMHMVIMRNDKAVMFDTVTTGPSLLRLPKGKCRLDLRSKVQGAQDCAAHAVEFDYATGGVRALKVLTDVWCSSGAVDAGGNLVQTGGYFEGEKVVRYLSPCADCDWREFPASLAEGRWYGTQQILPDGRSIVLGGRRAFSYEFVPAEGQLNTQANPLQILRDTTDDVENNLYPFVHLLTDGTLFVFANDRSIVFDYRTGQVVRELPVLPGGGRNYPASGMSALLPLDLRRGDVLSPEVIVCGGAPKNAFKLGEANTFNAALRDCARINPLKPNARWATDQMPVSRTMGDLLILPTGDLLMLNGAARGCSGWGFARQPVLTPLLYSPRQPRGSRFRALAATTIARMYHATSAVLPDATVLVAGSNTNSAYNFSGVDFPTEVRVERFTPPYLAPERAANRPAIDAATVPADGMAYVAQFTFQFSTPAEAVAEADLKVTMYAPPFTTHGYSMNQRLLVLRVSAFVAHGQTYTISVDAPGKPELAPPGYYLLYVMAKGVPSKAAWVKVHQ